MTENILTRHYFNGVAEQWEAKKIIEDAEIENLLSKLDWTHCKTILDIGCGTGVLFPYLEKTTNQQMKIYAMDFAECMISEAAQKKYPSIKLFCGCARYLPLHDNSIDRIIAFHVIPHIKSKQSTLKECWRVLKPNGELAILHIHSSEKINSIHSEIGGAVKGHFLPSANQLGKMLNETGFYVKAMIDRSGEYYVSGIKMSQLPSN